MSCVPQLNIGSTSIGPLCLCFCGSLWLTAVVGWGSVSASLSVCQCHVIITTIAVCKPLDPLHLWYFLIPPYPDCFYCLFYKCLECLCLPNWDFYSWLCFIVCLLQMYIKHEYLGSVLWYRHLYTFLAYLRLGLCMWYWVLSFAT